jgi:hypothetical protein
MMNAQISILGTFLQQRRGGAKMRDYDLRWDKFYNEAIERGFSKEAAELCAQLKADDLD